MKNFSKQLQTFCTPCVSLASPFVLTRTHTKVGVSNGGGGGGGLTPRARNVFLGREKSNFLGGKIGRCQKQSKFCWPYCFSALLFLALCFCPFFFHCRCEKSGFQEEKIMGFVWDGGRLLPSPLPSYQEERVQEGTKSRLTPKTELGLLGLASRDGKQHRSPWFLPSPLSLFFFT